MRKVLNVEPYGYSPKAITLWEETGYEYISTSWDQVYENLTYTDVEVLIVRLNRKIDYKELSFFPTLKIVVSATTGHDHLNLEALEEKGIRLISLKGYNDFLNTIPSTAEHTWALIQGLIRKIPMAYNDVRLGNWHRDNFRGYQLKGKTIGIIGLGRTGIKVAKFAQAFDMNVVYYDPYVGSELYTKLNLLDDLLEQSDVISIHVYLNDQTYHLLNKDNILKVKQNCYLVNTSRANVWDEQAVVEGVEQNRIAGVATDVLNTELEDIRMSPLWQASKKHEVILITPHIGGATWDAMWSCEEFIVSIL